MLACNEDACGPLARDVSLTGKNAHQVRNNESLANNIAVEINAECVHSKMRCDA